MKEIFQPPFDEEVTAQEQPPSSEEATTQEQYAVVFEGVGGDEGGFLGVRTWKVFENKEDFEKWMDETGCPDKIIARGCSYDEAVAHCRDTAPSALVAAALQEATTKGEIDIRRLTLAFETIVATHQLKIGSRR